MNKKSKRAILISSLLTCLLIIQLGYSGDSTEFHQRPFPMGLSISTTPTLPFITAGTAGMRVRSLSNPNLKFILSNSHVLSAVGPTLCPDTSPFGTWIIQPGTLDLGTDPGNNPLFFAGLFANAVPIDFSPGASNLVDAAIAFTTPNFSGTEIHDIGEPTPEFALATVGMPVIKSGRTTGVTQGTVTAINVTSFVNYGDDCGTARFVNQVAIGGGTFSMPGDSGSVILHNDVAGQTLRPVALLFAGSAINTLANHILFVYLNLGVFPDQNGTPADAAVSMGSIKKKINMAKRRIASLAGIQAAHEQQIMALDGVVGIGIGKSAKDGKACFVVFCAELTDDITQNLPDSLEGIPVELRESGPFEAY